MNTFIKLLIITATISVLLLGCRPLVKTPPLRDFTTLDLLIRPDLLPNGWVISSQPRMEERSDAMGLHNTLNGSEIELHSSGSTLDQMIILFRTSSDAVNGYEDHDYTRNTKGLYPITWKPLSGYQYKSPRANKFRIVCATIENVPKLGDLCIIEAQYDEFLSILIYDTATPSHAEEELDVLAKIIDSQVMKYLGK